MMQNYPPLKTLPFLVLLGCASLAMVHCGREEVSGPASCAEIGDKATQSAPNPDEPAFKVITPNGGESFKVGDSITVRLGANAKGTSALVYLVVKSAASTRQLRMPGTPGNRSLDPRSECEVRFKIPAVIEESGVSHSLVSDAVKVRVAAYNSETLYFDESDGTFRIAP